MWGEGSCLPGAATSPSPAPCRGAFSPNTVVYIVYHQLKCHFAIHHYTSPVFQSGVSLLINFQFCYPIPPLSEVPGVSMERTVVRRQEIWDQYALSPLPAVPLLKGLTWKEGLWSMRTLGWQKPPMLAWSWWRWNISVPGESSGGGLGQGILNINSHR